MDDEQEAGSASEQELARAAARESMMLMATLRGPAVGGETKARVRNLSEGGMMLELAMALPRGAAVVAEIPRVGEVSATVAWCADGRAGFRFDRPIDPHAARRPIGGGEGSPVYAKSLTIGPRSLKTR